MLLPSILLLLPAGALLPNVAPASSLIARRAPSPRCAIERKPGPRTAGAPPPDDLADKVMLSIVLQEMSDEDVNELVWKYLGYSRSADGEWDASAVFPKWAAKYPTPPDLVGVTRTYTREVDEPVLRAVQALQKSVPTEHKDNLRRARVVWISLDWLSLDTGGRLWGPRDNWISG